MFRSVAIDVYQKESGHGNVFVAMRLVKCTLRCDPFCLVNVVSIAFAAENGFAHLRQIEREFKEVA